MAIPDALLMRGCEWGRGGGGCRTPDDHGAPPVVAPARAGDGAGPSADPSLSGGRRRGRDDPRVPHGQYVAVQPHHGRSAPDLPRASAISDVMEQMEQDPTEPHAGRSTFLLSSCGAGGGQY